MEPPSARPFALLLAAALLAAGCGGPGPAQSLRLEGEAYGTRWRAELVLREAPGEERAEALRGRVEAVLERIDRRMSTWREDAELARFNRRDGRRPVALSAETRRVVSAALDLARETDGAFDPTVGPLVALWGFGPDATTQEPTARALREARERVGWRRLGWDEEGRLVRRAPGVELDLSGIAKGYAVDAVVTELAAAGATGLLVEIGGEVRALGTKAEGAPWRVGIERPDAPGLEAVVRLQGAALATSGDYRQARRVGGRRITHVIDPRTGRPVSHGVASASVVAPTCMEADAVATALMVMEPEAGLAWVEARPWLEARLLLREEGRGVARRASSGWSRRVDSGG